LSAEQLLDDRLQNQRRRCNFRIRGHLLRGEIRSLRQLPTQTNQPRRRTELVVAVYFFGIAKVSSDAAASAVSANYEVTPPYVTA
jgi:hypothetical protein